MNNDLKNIGVSLALASIIDGLSLTKINVPSVGKELFIIKSDDGKINYTLNFCNIKDSEKILKDVMEYSYEKITDESCDYDTEDEDSQNESIVDFGNELRKYARDILYDIRSDYGVDNFQALQKYKKLKNSLNTLTNDFYVPCNEKDDSFEALEYALQFTDAIFGEMGFDGVRFDEEIINEEFTVDEWLEYLEESDKFIDKIHDYNNFDVDEYLEGLIDNDDMQNGEDENYIYDYDDDYVDLEKDSFDEMRDFVGDEDDDEKYREHDENLDNKQNDTKLSKKDEVLSDLLDEFGLVDPNNPLRCFTKEELAFIAKLSKKADELFGEEKDKDQAKRISDILSGKDDEENKDKDNNKNTQEKDDLER